MGTTQRPAGADATPAETKARALRSVSTAARRRVAAEETERLAIRLAKAAGASTREIAAAVGDRNHATIARMLNKEDDTGA